MLVLVVLLPGLPQLYTASSQRSAHGYKHCGQRQLATSSHSDSSKTMWKPQQQNGDHPPVLPLWKCAAVRTQLLQHALQQQEDTVGPVLSGIARKLGERWGNGRWRPFGS